MNYNTYSESDMESETNFQQPTSGRVSNSNNNNNNGGNFVRNNSIKNSSSNKQQQQHKHQPKSSNVRRRASDCSFYGLSGDGGDNISYYGVPLRGQKRESLNGTGHGMNRSHSNKSSLSSSSGDVSSHSGSSTCSGDDTTSTSSGPNLPYPGFVEYSFKYLSQDALLRNWCLQLITNP
ncbi:hypothetical protein PVAND_002388 [Polypedilum vanderplanki]|uniref:Uncharacterized protein n=1 Tax=Polypedilum vanderplanki TaxID=319348 RepID=A0A9J6BSC4_POLVA|nr:hypothetical protein PVAND_002388 [Polypedilum vanderplanki]